jgi:hypothetical protein
MTFKIDAIIGGGGDHLAKFNYPKLIPTAAKYFPEIEGCGVDGTINLVNLRPPLSRSRAD